MEQEINTQISYIVTFIGVCLTFFIGIINFFQSRKNNYVNSITKYRVEWINTLRIYVSEFKTLSNTTQIISISKAGKDKKAYRREIERITSLIKMHLNFLGKIDKEIIIEIEELKILINSYILLSHYRNISDLNNRGADLKEFLKDISNKKTLGYILEIANCIKGIDIDELKNLNITQQKKRLLGNNSNYLMAFQEKLFKNIDSILDKILEEFDIKNNTIDRLFQIYLKAEWTRCKKETRLWPFNNYNEDKIVCKLKKQYDNNIKW